MKHYVISYRQHYVTRLMLLTLALCITAIADAQTFTRHLQEKKAGQGSVTVTQSKDIEELVNGANVSAIKQTPVQGSRKPATPPATSSSTPPASSSTPSPSSPVKKPTPDSAARQNGGADGDDTDSSSTPTDTDMHKKTMRRSYKVNGYRVQVFAGGNSREDKNKAQQTGNALKQYFPSQPVYVHFYSPRWICRMGNYRTYEEANAILQQVRKMGYSQACIVSGKITVAY